MIRDALFKAMKKLGYANGHKLPVTGNNTDPLLHELYIATQGASYFTARRKKALSDLESNGFLSDLPEPGDSGIVAKGKVYNLLVKVSNPANRLNHGKLIIKLAEYGISDSDVRKILDGSKTLSAPAKAIEAVSAGIRYNDG